MPPAAPLYRASMRSACDSCTMLGGGAAFAESECASVWRVTLVDGQGAGGAEGPFPHAAGVAWAERERLAGNTGCVLSVLLLLPPLPGRDSAATGEDSEEDGDKAAGAWGEKKTAGEESGAKSPVPLATLARADCAGEVQLRLATTGGSEGSAV